MNGNFSLVHLLLGLAVPFLGPDLGHVLTVGFIVYQVTEREQWSSTIGDLAQFAAGYVGGESLAGAL